MRRMGARLRGIAMMLAMLLSVGRPTPVRGQAGPIYQGVLASNVITVSWSGVCQPTISTNYTVTQGTTTISLNQTGICGAHKFTFQGTLQLNFPAVTPDATITFPGVLDQINWSPGLQSSATFDGQWQLSGTVSGNTLEILNSVGLTGDVCPELQLPTYGPGLSDQSYPVMLTQTCSTTNQAFPAVIGTDLIYGIGASAGALVYAPSNATPDTQIIFGLSVSAEAVYLVATAAWIVVDNNQVHFDIGSTNPASQTVWITNTGTANLNFSVETNVTSGGNWLSVSPSQGTLTPNQATNLSISVDVTSLAPDQVTNTGQILISGNSANSPQTIQVETVNTNVDLAVLSLAWNATTNAGLDLIYANLVGSLPVDTTAKLFWANGTNLANAFTNNPIWTTNIPAGFTGMSSNHVAESLFYLPPTNATYLVLALDPNNLITESNKANNVMALRNTFRHVVLVMMENRSFDHYLGWLSGADGKQAGLNFTNNYGQAFATWPLAPHFQGCSCDQPDQSFGATNEFNNGACDGWLRANTNGLFTIGYYLQTNLDFFGQIAPAWTACDRYFCALMAETQPNRIYQHAGQTDALTNRTSILSVVTLPTIWDRLSHSNINARYYYASQSVFGSVLFLWGSKYSSINYQIGRFYQDCSNGTLPAVSYVDPDFESVQEALGQGNSGGNDDHPNSDIRNGEAFLAGIYNALVTSSNWSSTVLIINFDEWGGFFDHVAPPVAQIEPAEQALGNNGRLGFRVPCIVISPWSRRAYVSHEQFDHCSVLKLIENRWLLSPLTVRDQNANDLADVLDLDHPNFSRPPPLTNVPAGPFGFPCNTLQVVRLPDGSFMLTWDDTCPRALTIQQTPNVGQLALPWTDITNVSSSPLVLPPAQASGYYRYQIKP